MLKYQKRLAYTTKYLINAFSTIKTNTEQFFKMDNFIWIDMEMSGLDPVQHRVLEIACIITCPQLKPVHEGLHIIIHQPNKILNSMNDWSMKNHAESGLIKSSQESNISESEADEQMAKYITDHTEGTRYIAGNSVHMDRLFLIKYFPKTSSLLHYRILDVSSIKILCRHWYPDEFHNVNKKKSVHRALDDIKNSIKELQYYKKEIFK